MNIRHVQELLANEYSEVKEIRPSLFRADHLYKNHLVGIYFFDCSKELLNPCFDLESYQDQILWEEYYRNTGAAQWNFYLYFVCDENEFSALLNTGQIYEIEKNRIFARKYVVTEDHLDHELLHKIRSRKKTCTDIPADISTRWIEKLRAQKLDGVFLKEPITQVVKRFIDGDPIVEDIDQNAAEDLPEESPISFINRIKIDDYRPCLTKKHFSLGLSNLIEGVNGCGKTSLLEAIELWICGQTFRNLKGDEEKAEIGLQFLNSNSWKWNNYKDKSFFRERDMRWYGNHYTYGNKLCHGFNRFNFYNADAAVELQEKADEKNIQEAISRLILGETANTIEKRLNDLLPNFKREQKSYSEKLKGLKEKIEEAREELKALGPTQEKEQKVFDQFIAGLKNAGWKGMLPEDNSPSLNKFLNELSKVSTRVEECKSQLSWLPSFSISTIRIEKKGIENLTNNINDVNQHIYDTENQVKEKIERIESTTIELEKIKKLKSYIFDKEISKLPGLNKAISDKEEEKNRYLRTMDAIGKIKLENYLHIEKSIADLESTKQKRIVKLQEDINTLKQSIHKFEQKHGRIVKLCAEIRSKGSELISQDPDIKKCPLCGMDYELDELTKRILEQQDELKQSDIMADYIKKLNRRQTILEMQQKSIEELKRLKKAASIIFDTIDSFNLPINKVIQGVACIQEDLQKSEKVLDELLALKERFAIKGLKEKEYEELKQWLQQNNRTIYLEYSERSKFDSLVCRKEKYFQKLKINLPSIREGLSVFGKKKESLIREYFKSNRLKGDEELELRRRREQVETVLNIFQEVIQTLSDSSEENISDLSLRLKEIQATYNRFKQSQKHLEESAHIRAKNEKKIEKAQFERKIIREKKERIDKAINTIMEIFENDSKEKYLEEFMQNNIQEIVEIFRMIHAPREFSHIEFDNDQGGQLILIRKDTGAKNPVTKISSGQRAALSLSLFLALNSKLVEGPPLIIFDDPVAYVDDLNILSFLDYLREVVIAGGRQIFFATANKKVATLFKKKFDFLSDDFKCITLNRR